MYWQWSPGLAPDRSYLYSQVAESTRQCILPVTSRQLCPPLYHYTIYIVIVNRYSLIIILVRKSISINDLAATGLPKTLAPFQGLRLGEILWTGRIYFITSKFSGYDMSWSLLLTTISRLYGTCPSSWASCAVVISYWLPHFQPPSYSKRATLAIYIVLYYSFFQRFCKNFNVLPNYNRC